MKKVIILFISIFALGLSGCSQQAKPAPRPSQVKTIKVVNYQVNSKSKHKTIKKKSAPKLNFFILPNLKKNDLVYTNSNNILEN